ncbi:uncharacterized protein BDW43DRAFT_38789 [Aspergillus alliaceus]|uniref:uncharacterized protein n=1 Tax=Petromyces alliaceus TaxID=209559 RepID=UPI0012A6266C|nr:uncharacterized protein BDW43DRAFT_38789 [Aspergillus alliaceus]KAB8235087.1 hypothetical protein BDW43DRAFT_38789 [Aspergillus alliaceus]
MSHSILFRKSLCYVPLTRGSSALMSSGSTKHDLSNGKETPRHPLRNSSRQTHNQEQAFNMPESGHFQQYRYQVHCNGGA